MSSCVTVVRSLLTKNASSSVRPESAPPRHCEQRRVSGPLIGREFFPHDLSHGVECRSSVNMLEQGIIDQRLIVATAGLVDQVSKILEHRVIKADRDLRLARLGRDDGAALRAREIDVPTLLSYDLFHKAARVYRHLSATARGLRGSLPPSPGSFPLLR